MNIMIDLASQAAKKKPKHLAVFRLIQEIKMITHKYNQFVLIFKISMLNT